MTARNVSFREMLEQVEERRLSVIREAAQAAWPGEEFEALQEEICTSWGDFRTKRYAYGQFLIGKRAIARASYCAVFNGTETTMRFPAFVNGEPKIAVRTSFSPDFGHASYGSLVFEDVPPL